MKIPTLLFSLITCFATWAADPAFVTSDPNGGWSEGSGAHRRRGALPGG